ncbi:MULTISPECIES: class E sortase [unclassified Corynebacterium]|uniref:class E sortase n=1 Tax=unclassified Corynebacterium TaxID=2624378 RepID=UPI0030B1B32B
MFSRIIGVIGELLITAGVIAALFAFYLLYWTGVENSKIQGQAADDLRSAWNQPVANAAQPDPNGAGNVLPGNEGANGSATWAEQGNPVAFLTAPKAGINELVAFEGVDQGTLAAGPGHYPDTALPGQVGNSSFAAHRDGNGAPFDNIDVLGTCDDITVETRDAVYHYKVLPLDGLAGAGETFDCVPEGTEIPALPGSMIVTPDRVDVVNPSGNATMLTFTTCHPKWDNTHRLIVHAVLAGVDQK